MENKEKIAIGFDLGTESVGWSVIKINNLDKDKKLEILDMGVRLFEDPASNDSNIEHRRLARGRRRRIHRLKIRKDDFYKLLKSYNLILNEEQYKKYIETSIYDEIEERYKLPIDIKRKGLNEKLSKHELILILHNYIKHRGTLNTIDLSEDEENNKNKDSENLYDNSKFPCENQYQWFLVTGKIIGNPGNYLISNDEYKKEIEKILSNQKHLGINDKFIDEFIKLFSRHRHYSEGPGSEKSPTKYGRFEKKLDSKGNIIELKWCGEHSNLWDLLIGKCTYYPEENRNYKKSPITEIFNLLNDFSNLRVKDEILKKRYLKLDEKIKILKLNHSKLTLDKMLKEISLSKKDIIGGLKGIENNKPIIEELKSTRKILKWLEDNKIRSDIDLTNLDDLNFIDSIFSLGVQKQNESERIEYILKKNYDNLKSNLDDEQINKLYKLVEQLKREQIEDLAKLKIYYSGTSSLSKKAQLEYIKFVLNSTASDGKNQMQYFSETMDKRPQKNNFEKYKFFPENYFKDEIMSLTVKRAFNQSTKVLNALIKRYTIQKKYDLSHIIIELARELNSAEEKERIDRENKNNKKFLEDKMKEFNLTEDALKKGENRLKFLLWIQQNKQDIYDGKSIELSDLLSNPNVYHIDHVLPISISFIDSMQNKVLTKSVNNQMKQDLTPYQWLSREGKYEEYKKRCLKLLDNENDKKRKSKLKNKIYEYLLYEKDPFSELIGFVGRHLSDTRYISTMFANQLKNFFKQSKYWKEKNKIVINNIIGSLTTFARKNFFSENDCTDKLLYKNRDIYSHHAIDASIIAFLGLNSNIQNLLKHRYKNISKKTIDDEEKWVDEETGEIVADKSNFFKKDAQHSLYFRDQMREFLDPKYDKKFVRFSKMKVNKNNVSLSNETLYSVYSIEDKENKKNIKKYKVSKFSLLESELETLNDYFGSNPKNKEKLLMYIYDRKMYEKLNLIFLDDKYNNQKKNPFKQYLEDEFVLNELKNNNIDVTKISLLDKIPIFDDKNSKIIHWIRNLRILGSLINDDEEIMLLKKHNSKAFYDSLNPIGVRVYKTKDNKYQTIFINALNLKWDANQQKLIIDEEKINSILKKKNIDTSSKYLEIKKGMTLIKDDNLYYFKGGGTRSQNKLEIAALFAKNDSKYVLSKWPNAPKRKQWIIAISTICKEFKLCKVDSLGYVYDIKSFDEYFENNT